MKIRARLVGLTLVGAFVGWGVQPTDLAAQIGGDGALQGVGTETVTPGPQDDARLVEALRRPSTIQLLVPPLERLSVPSAEVDAVAMPQSGGGGKGMAFMIAGGAALVGGLIIGGNTGTVIAAAGVALGVYGVILYF